MVTGATPLGLRRVSFAEVVWELGHALWHTVRALPDGEQYERMREPVHGDLVIELTHRYEPAATIRPELIGWFAEGDKYRPVIAPLGADYRRVKVENGVIVALPIRDERFAVPKVSHLPELEVTLDPVVEVPGRPEVTG